MGERERDDDYADKTMVYYKLSLCYAMHGVYGKRERERKIYQGNYDTENRRTKKKERNRP